MEQQTICAISTPPGTGGIAVIRISGEHAISYADKIFTPKTHAVSLNEQEGYKAIFGTIFHSTGEPLDEVVVTVFRNPHSFTGEDTVEISCHGSPYIQQQILHLLLQEGARLAQPGEFTQRAFLNGKMDLSQAEAVADLISSSSTASHRLAMNQMRGGFSDTLKELRAKLLDFVSLIELELDFSEEDVEFADRGHLTALVHTIRETIEKLANSFQLGNVIKAGIPVAIVGETNAGKSTLLNLLLNEEKAIVSDIHGTTRDVIEDIVNVQGITFRFIDTAGIRDTGDTIETLGIERTFRKIEQASIVLWMIDATQISEKIDSVAEKILPRTKEKKLIILFNKTDKLSPEEQTLLKNEFLPLTEAVRIPISAKYNQNSDILEKALVDAANIPSISGNDVIVTNLRHYEALVNALDAINRVESGLKQGISGDFLSQDIRECMHYLGEITGQISTDEVLGNIFGKFCIGK
ncbi:MAG: tRNA uridine-5-carboxymethylaminomethyl(34) synthesis GTPase MnmE [Candidatus Azobacteroides sp.]|nr:tRNA uridine-5-carboxymethylaminomethyl(34) synthesis GTPase MnmE [Candidatus Azobacteroides sp.]